MATNKITYGLKSVYYAKVTMSGTTAVYGSPIAIPGAVSIALDKDQERTNIAGDDNAKYAIVSQNNGYSGTLEILNLPESFLADCLGMTVSTADGTILENKDDAPSNFALLWQFAGDKKNTRHVLYNCFATNPKIEGNTKGDSVEAQTVSLDISAAAAEDTGDIKYSCAESSSSTYTNWFTAVQKG